ncbi:MAG: DUF6691 family protein [Oceanospirillaceae bacterium]
MALLKPSSLLYYISVITCGFLFATGLQISEMANPKKVLGFLDVTGRWDPSLILVLCSALFIFTLCFHFLIKPKIMHSKTPLLADKFHLPTKQHLDKPLFIGAALFGIGWGISGLCPGPALVNLIHIDPKIITFIIAMLVGMKIAGFVSSK